MAFSTESIPVLLLKTKSTPGDSYEELFSQQHNGRAFAPRFVPVLHHQFKQAGLEKIQPLLETKQISDRPEASYGGLIFTSQRAVEAFAHLVEQGKGSNPEWPHLQNVPVYSVGPATTRALRSIPQQPQLNVYGEHTGTGEVLAKYMLEHYADWYRGRQVLPPLLFPVGEQRRDIIPKTLMDPTLPDDKRIQVDETVIYGTGVMESFPSDFARILADTTDKAERWVVVFSPTGCDSMLRGLGYLDPDTNKAVPGKRDGKTWVATIGPTTRDYLKNTLGFEPDVCADAPSPDGVLQAILSFKANR